MRNRRMAAVLVLLFFFTPNVFACSCTFSDATYDAVFERASMYDVIFIGKIDSVGEWGSEGTDGDRRWTSAMLVVEESLKGLDSTSEIQVFSEISSCAAPFFADRRHVVFANYDDVDGRLYTSACGLDLMPSEIGEDDEHDLKSFLRERLELLREVCDAAA